MLYALAKGIQGIALLLIGVSFIKKFPNLMDPKIFCIGILVFLSGWLIERHLLKS